MSSRVSVCAVVTKAFSRSHKQAPKRYFETVHDSSLPQASQFTEQVGTAVRLQTCVQDLFKVGAVQQDSAMHDCVQGVLGSISAWGSAVLTKVCVILRNLSGPLPKY